MKLQLKIFIYLLKKFFCISQVSCKCVIILSQLKKKVKKQRTCSITGKSLIFGDKWICFLKIPVKYFKGMNSDSFPMAAINRIPQSGWCDKAEMLSLPVLEVTSLTANCQEGHILPEGSRGKSFLALPSSCQQPLAFLGL